MISPERDPKPYLHTASGSVRGFALKFTDQLIVAAAAKYDHNSKNNDPGAVIVKEMAQAVVVHICFPPNDAFASLFRLLNTIICEGKTLVIEMFFYSAAKKAVKGRTKPPSPDALMSPPITR